MKRAFLLIALISVFGLNGFSQKSKSASVIKSEVDTISYSYGASLVQQGLKQYMFQLGVLTDTTQLRMTYQSQMDMEQDQIKRGQLKKEFTFKLDSINKANQANLTSFIKGISESASATVDKSSYFKGIGIGSQITEMAKMASTQFFPESDKKLNISLLVQGLTSELKGEALLIPDATTVIEKKMADAQSVAAKQAEIEAEAKYKAVKEAGDKFLQENSTKQGVVTLPSGLQYQVIEQGTGARPVATDMVKVHYTGTLLDGTVFDSSVERGEPITLTLNQVIPGWTEALQLMPVGSKWKLFIPYDLGYGSREAGSIKPFSTLIFDVELIDIESAK